MSQTFLKERRWEILWVCELGKAISQLAPLLSQPHLHQDSDTRIHEARKSIKRLRSALRLFRESFPPELVRKINHSLRQAAHAIGLVRDQKTLRSTLLKVARIAGIKPPKASPIVPFRHPIAEALRHLLRVEKDSGKLEWGKVDHHRMRRGLERLYRRCGRAMIRAHGNRSDVRLHTWRKCAKDLAYALRLIGADHSPFAEKVRRVEHLLGIDHDLALLQKTPPLRSKGNVLQGIAHSKRHNHQKKAFCLGHLLFCRPTKRLIRRLR